jgi:nicotinamidase-related amidase
VDEKEPDEIADAVTAELFGAIAAGRPDHLGVVALAQLPEALRPTAVALHEAYARLGHLVAPKAPPSAVRDRILASVRARTTRSARSALLVIDMQNDHLTPGGPLEVPRARAIVPALRARIEAARRERVPVIYVVDEHEPDDPDLATWRAHNVRGTSGVEVWSEIAPHEGDRVVRKPTYSAFTRSSLADELDAAGVDTLVLTGCLTEIGVQATAVDALQRGYAVEIPPDCQAGISPETEAATLGLLRVMPPYGQARADLLARVARSAPPRAT